MIYDNRHNRSSDTPCFQALFSQTAQRVPEQTAVIDGERAWSYAELETESDLLSLYLQGRGAQPDQLIIIFMSASYEYILSALSILKAGSAFLPVPVDLPLAQVQMIVDDADPAQILTTPRDERHLEGLSGGHPILSFSADALDDVFNDVSREHSANLSVTDQALERGLAPLVITQPDHLAFATYTSGTTGKPKGVLQVQRALVTSYQSRYQYRPYTSGERVACNIFFMWECLRPLIYGAAVVVIPDQLISIPKKLARLLEEHEVSEVLFTPSAFQRLIRSLDPDELRAQLTHLRTVWLNGEVVSASLVREGIAALPDTTSLLNTYSICECHDVSNSDLRALDLAEIELTREGVCPVGRAVEGVSVRVMREGELYETGEGELYIGGQGLGRGYLHLDELTQERFPHVDGARYYATGDRAELDERGLITIKGRLHSMVKMRGYSVYLGAIEEALRRHPEIRDARVFLRGDHLSQHLTAFLVHYAQPDSNAQPRLSAWVNKVNQTSPQLREWLSETLPAYMIPSKWVTMDSFPVHPISGKLDQAALWSLEREDESSLEQLARAPQHTRGERLYLMRCLWARALEVEVEQLDERADFFEMGGHSLSAVDLVIAVEELFGVTLEGDELYTHSRLADFTRVTLREDARSKGSNGSNGSDKDELDASAREDRVDTPEGVEATVEATIRPFWTPEDITLTFPEGHAWAPRGALDGCSEPSASAARTQLSAASSILITGATGYLGLGLLESLLNRVDLSTEIICLVRSAVGAEGERVSGARRLSELYLKAGFGSLDGHFERGRLLVVEGDVSAPSLGLPTEIYTSLTRRVELIFHCAALVNLKAPYHQTKPSIVDGTRNIISFAADQKLKTLHHISTNSVIAKPQGEPCEEDLSLEGLDAHLTDGYSQAKWVAEVLVEEAIKLGLSATIYRPGNIGPHRATHFANPRDLQQLIWSACAETRVVPLNTGWRFELIPVDMMAALILELADLDAPRSRYHLVHPRPLEADELFSEWLDHGQAARGVDGWREWREALAEASVGAEERSRAHLRVLASALSAFNDQLTVQVEYSLAHLREDLPTRADYFDHPPELNEFFQELLT